jgi:hypothetical protein
MRIASGTSFVVEIAGLSSLQPEVPGAVREVTPLMRAGTRHVYKISTILRYVTHA